MTFHWSIGGNVRCLFASLTIVSSVHQSMAIVSLAHSKAKQGGADADDVVGQVLYGWTRNI